MRRTSKHVSVQALVKEMIEAGAVIRQTPAGTWFVDGLPDIPRYLVDEFYRADERALVAYLRELERRGLEVRAA